MVFSSFDFLFIFLPLALGIYHIARRLFVARTAFAILVVLSLIFYAYWKIEYLFVILASIGFNYLWCKWMAAAPDQHRRKILLTGIGFNVLVLFVFKYLGFTIENVNEVTGAAIPIVKLALPLGISFFTFQQIAFLVDRYVERRGPGNFIEYALFVTFFPQLIAGPIVHHAEMMPQFNDPVESRPTWDKVSLGFFIFSIGFAKKVLIADKLAPVVNRGFDPDNTFMTMQDAWLSMLSYTMQLLFDFSGYAAMAIGIGLFFGIRLPINFDAPYQATSIQDFWRRWHITLSRFLRDYIYIPLGGGRVAEWKIYRNLFLTFLIGGIWHGAGWTFFVWGAAHGVATVIHRYWTKKVPFQLPGYMGWLVTFLFVNIAWVFFRAPDFPTAIRIIESLTFLDSLNPLVSGFQGAVLQLNLEQAFPVTKPTLYQICTLVAATVIALKAPSVGRAATQFKGRPIMAVMAAVLFILSVSQMESVNEFLYFDF